MIDEEQQLHNIIRFKKTPVRKDPSRLGAILEEFLQKELAPKRRQADDLSRAWLDIVPADIAPHCRCDGILNGQLKVIVDSPAYMYQLKILSAELLDQLGEPSRRTRIKAIKLTIGSV